MNAPLSLHDHLRWFPPERSATTAGRWEIACERIAAVVYAGFENDAALSYATCPYYRNVDGGRCLGSCYDEPRCQTDEPIGGWQARDSSGRLIAAGELDRTALERWNDHKHQQGVADILANTVTPAELAEIQRQDEEDMAESDRLEAKYFTTGSA